MSITPTSVKFNLDLPAKDSSGPINDFGAHKFIVLRFVSQQENGFAQPEVISHNLTLSNTRINEVLEKLVEDKYLLPECGGFTVTMEGKAVLEKL